MAELTAGPREDGQLSIAPVGSLVLFRLRFPAGGRSSGVTPLSGGRLSGSSISQGRRFYGRIDGISCLPSCASRRRRTVSHPSPPAPISGEIGGPDSQQRLPTGCAAAINDDYEAE